MSYGRDTLTKILGVPQKAADYAAMHALPPMPLNELGLEIQLPAPVPAPMAPLVTLQPPVRAVPDGVHLTRHVTPSGREYFTYKYDGVKYRSEAAMLRAVLPTLDAALTGLEPVYWRHHHCESSRCTFDLGHQGPHSHDLVAGKRRR